MIDLEVMLVSGIISYLKYLLDHIHSVEHYYIQGDVFELLHSHLLVGVVYSQHIESNQNRGDFCICVEKQNHNLC